MNVLSIDFGDARIGLAHATTDVKLALPLRVLQNTPQVWKDIQDILQEYDIDYILVGLPINLDSQDTIQTQKVRTFVEILKEKFTGTIELLDERMTSVMASRYLEKGQSIDVESARILLEEWLEKKINL